MLMNHLVHSNDCQRNMRYWELAKIYILVTNDLYQMKVLSFRQNSSPKWQVPFNLMWFLKAASPPPCNWSWFTYIEKTDRPTHSSPTPGAHPVVLNYLPYGPCKY